MYYYKLLFVFFTLFFFVPAGPGVRATSVKTLTLEQLVTLSETIVRGTVKDITVEDDIYESGFLVNYYTVAVEEVLKGDAGEEFVYKQLADTNLKLPHCAVGSTCLFFIPEATEYTGLVAPVGLYQGLYHMEKRDGRWTLPALRKKTALKNQIRAQIKGLRLNLSRAGDDYAGFRAAIKTLAGTN